MTDQDPLEYLREEMESRPNEFSIAMNKLAAMVETEWKDLRLASALRLAGNEACRLVSERPGPGKAPPAASQGQEGGGA